MRSRATFGLAFVAILLAGLVTGVASGERAQRGNLIVSLDGDFFPHELPRDRLAPVGVRLGSEIHTSEGSPLPQVKQVELLLAGRGLISTRGLPVCPRARLRNASSRQALERCAPALVGQGRLAADVALPQQRPFAIHSRLLAFNGRTKAGRRGIWMHTFATDPPISFVLPFVVHRRPGVFGTALVATVPKSAGPAPRLASFEMTFLRRFREGRERRSYLSASCPAPAHFTAGFLTFARIIYTFADGRQLRTETVRSCRARR